MGGCDLPNMAASLTWCLSSDGGLRPPKYGSLPNVVTERWGLRPPKYGSLPNVVTERWGAAPDTACAP